MQRNNCIMYLHYFTASFHISIECTPIYTYRYMRIQDGAQNNLLIIQMAPVLDQDFQMMFFMSTQMFSTLKT